MINAGMIKYLKNSSCKGKLKKHTTRYIRGDYKKWYRISIQKDCCTKNFDLAVHISGENKTSRNDTDKERILSEMAVQRWIYWEANDTYPSGPLTCLGPFQGLRRYARHIFTCSVFLKFTKLIHFNHNQFRLLVLSGLTFLPCITLPLVLDGDRITEAFLGSK